MPVGTTLPLVAPMWKGEALPGTRRVEVSVRPVECMAKLQTAFQALGASSLTREGWLASATMTIDAQVIIVEAHLFEDPVGTVLVLSNLRRRDVVRFHRAANLVASALRDCSAGVVGLALSTGHLSRLPAASADAFDDYFAADELCDDEELASGGVGALREEVGPAAGIATMERLIAMADEEAEADLVKSTCSAAVAHGMLGAVLRGPLVCHAA